MQLKHEIISDDQHMQLYYTTVESNNELLPAHWHEHLEILCIKEGQMTAWTGDHCHHLHPGDIFIANPREIHFTKSDAYCLYYMLQIPPTHLKRIGSNWQALQFQEYIPQKSTTSTGDQTLSAALNNTAAFGVRKLAAADSKNILAGENLNQELNALFTLINDLHDRTSQEEKCHLLLLSKVYELLYVLTTCAAQTIDTRTADNKQMNRERIELCMDYVQEHYSESITLADAAALLSVSPEHFCRLFRRQTGQTFLSYVAQIRMHHFYQDLLHTDLPISLLLDRNGITNYKVFLKQFHAAYGDSPKQIRKTAVH